MATLNIRNFPEDLYKKLKASARKHRRSLGQEVTEILSRAVGAQGVESITDLKGLGKDLWSHIDPSAHVATERESWR